jgi:multisubunit Na+/H+ antiporter MnhC subunit
MGYVVLPLAAEATNVTGDDTVAPVVGELIVTPDVVAAALTASALSVLVDVKNSLIDGADAAAPGKLVAPNAVRTVRSKLGCW